MNNLKNPNELYEKIVEDQNFKFWGFIPETFGDVVKYIKNNMQANKTEKSNSEKLEKLKSILIQYHKSMGIISKKVEENINLLSNGSILTGQQPVVFGGPGFIGNKIGCLIYLTELAKQNNLNLAPIFFLGDYDGLQKELTRQYYPNPISHSAFILDSEGYLPEESNIASHSAKIPPREWLDGYLEKLTENLRGFKKQVKGDRKKLFDERWDHIQTLLKTSILTSETLSDWSVKIWGTLTNVISDYGIVYLPTSNPEVRSLIADQYLKYISNIKNYVSEFKATTERLVELGYEPTLPSREEDYSPFTLECTEDNNRINTIIKHSDYEIFAEGICPACKKEYSYNVSNKEQISKIATIIGPRVDSSQAVFQNILNIKVRISGPGEIAYYAQAAPAIKKIGFQLPIFVKYKRAFYNAQWIENLGKLLESRKKETLHNEELFRILRDRMEGIKNDDHSKVKLVEREMTGFIKSRYEKLINEKQSIDIQKYLGWQFGRFTSDKFGQEVSWVWFDLALQSGLSDYISTYSRIYSENSVLGGYWYINSIL